MTDTSKKPKVYQREDWYDDMRRMSPEEGEKVRRELGRTRVRMIPKKKQEPKGEKDS